MKQTIITVFAAAAAVFALTMAVRGFSKAVRSVLAPNTPTIEYKTAEIRFPVPDPPSFRASVPSTVVLYDTVETEQQVCNVPVGLRNWGYLPLLDSGIPRITTRGRALVVPYSDQAGVFRELYYPLRGRRATGLYAGMVVLRYADERTLGGTVSFDLHWRRLRVQPRVIITHRGELIGLVTAETKVF